MSAVVPRKLLSMRTTCGAVSRSAAEVKPRKSDISIVTPADLAAEIEPFGRLEQGLHDVVAEITPEGFLDEPGGSSPSRNCGPWMLHTGRLFPSSPDFSPPQLRPPIRSGLGARRACRSPDDTLIRLALQAGSMVV